MRRRDRNNAGPNWPTFASLMPIEDIVVARDEGVRMRISGFVTAYDSYTNLGIVTHGSASVLVDFSLMLHPMETDEVIPNGFVLERSMGFQPPLKNTVQCFGCLEALQPEAIPQSFRDRQDVYEPRFVPPLTHVLRSTLTRVVNDLDLDLWVRAARTQSAAIERSTAEELQARRKDTSRPYDYAWTEEEHERRRELDTKRAQAEFEAKYQNRKKEYTKSGYSPWT